MDNNVEVINSSNNGEVQQFQAKDLETVRARMAVKTLNMTERMVDGMDTLLHRIDGIDNALALKINLDEASPKELYDYFNQAKESFKVRQDFLKTLSGYDVDTSKVQVEEAEEVESTTISEEDAERVKALIMQRTMGENTQS
jgi:hypothetical protein